MKIALAADHGGFMLKETVKEYLGIKGYEVIDFGAVVLNDQDDYPDFVLPMAAAVASGMADRGIACCGSGVGAAIAANKIPGVRASLITDHFSAHQGVEDDDLNVLCLGGRITGSSVALELVMAFLDASFSGAERHLRRLNKVKAAEQGSFPARH